MKECVFEIYSEEMPARFQKNARVQFLELFQKYAQVAGIAVEKIITHTSPMRLVLCAHIAPQTLAQIVQKRGPRVGASDQALLGFCKSSNIEQKDLVEENGYYMAYVQVPAQFTRELLPAIFLEIIQNFSWPKTMRWPESTLPWVRPVRHVMALYEGGSLPFDIPKWGLQSENFTFGHRFLAPFKIHVNSFEEYVTKLKKAHVTVDEKDRQQTITRLLNEEAAKHNFKVVEDPALLEEVTGLVEYPGIFIGHLDPDLFAIPEIVSITSMRVHQKCFAFRHESGPHKGSLAPAFAAIINTIPKDGGKALQQGYEKGMLKARLDDARFFYEMDVKTPLQDHLPKLDKIIYHEKLGTMGAKIQRHLGLLGKYSKIFDVTQDHLGRAITLSKCDLLTHMVGEFGELQGGMGEIYARVQGEDESVAHSLFEYYKPISAEDSVPESPLSISVALMDKMDTLVGFIGTGMTPTGSKDPFALRRCALGILRILLENKMNVDAFTLVKMAVESYKNSVVLNPMTHNDTLAFLKTRFEFMQKDLGFSMDVIQTCMPQGNDSFNVMGVHEGICTLNQMLAREEGKILLNRYKRALNILNAERKKDGMEATKKYNFDESVLIHPSEKILIESLKEYANHPNLENLHTLSSPIHDFFGEILVNDSDPKLRESRLALIESTIAVFHIHGDFTKLEG